MRVAGQVSPRCKGIVWAIDRAAWTGRPVRAGGYRDRRRNLGDRRITENALEIGCIFSVWPISLIRIPEPLARVFV